MWNEGQPKGKSLNNVKKIPNTAFRAKSTEQVSKR